MLADGLLRSTSRGLTFSVCLVVQAIPQDDSQELLLHVSFIPIRMAMPYAVLDDLTQIVAELEGHCRPAFDAKTAQDLKLPKEGVTRRVSRDALDFNQERLQMWTDSPVSAFSPAEPSSPAGLKYNWKWALENLMPSICSNSSAWTTEVAENE